MKTPTLQEFHLSGYSSVLSELNEDTGLQMQACMQLTYAADMQQQVAGGCHGRLLESVTSYQTSYQSMHIYLKNNQARFYFNPI